MAEKQNVKNSKTFIITESQAKLLNEMYSSNDDFENVDQILFLYDEENGCFDIDTCFDSESNDMHIYPGLMSDEEIEDAFGAETLDSMKKVYSARKGNPGLMKVFVDRREEPVDINDINAINEKLKHLVKTTKDWHVCGWILTDGTMLSYDVGNGTRGVDHNQYVTSIEGLDKYRFVEMGAIRCFPEDRICRFEIRKEPTEKQYTVLKSIFMCASGIEIDLGDGNKKVSYATFDVGIPEIKRIHGNPWNIIDTIKSFYSGEKRYSSEVSRFHEGKERKVFKITESQAKAIEEEKKREEELFYSMLNEAFHPKSSLVLKVKNYLDRNFQRTSVNDIDANGYPSKEKTVAWMDEKGDAMKSLNMSQLLDLLDDRFNSSIKDNDDRKEFLKQVIKDWYNGKITNDGLLSSNIVGGKK